jgi:NAD-dependent dihydropyrimidine dehydrogenase PreA subunit
MKRYDLSDRAVRSDAASTDPSQCNGCGVCMLSCPVWNQHHTKMLTYCGRTRASIGGAKDEDLIASAGACILCGSCEPLCPMGIRTQQATMALRQNLAERGLLPKPVAQLNTHWSVTPAASRLVLPGTALRADSKLASSVLRLLEQPVGLHVDDGYDITLALESGQAISDTRMAEFIAPLMRATELIVADGLLFNLLRSLLPSSITVLPLGQALLENPKVRAGLNTADFYMIETRAYNARRREFVALYDELREETGCFMNLDLQRVATPTGAASYHHRAGLENIVSIESQVRWLLEGRNAQRIVVEHLDDREAFAKYTKIPVVHLAEVVKA